MQCLPTLPIGLVSLLTLKDEYCQPAVANLLTLFYPARCTKLRWSVRKRLMIYKEVLALLNSSYLP